MARNWNTRHVVDTTLGAITTTPPNIQVQNTSFPTGDEGIAALNLFYKGTFNTSGAGGSPVTDGSLKFLRALTVQTDKHGKLIDGVDGLGLFRLQQMGERTKGANADCTSNADATTFNAQYRVAFADEQRLWRPFDTLLDMRNSIMTVKRAYGVVTDVQSAGANPTVNGFRDDLSVEVLPGPINTGQPDPALSELPGFIPMVERIPFTISATKNQFQIPIPTGDRIVRRIYLSQQTIDPTTGLVTEVSNIVSGTAQVSFKVGRDVLFDNLTFNELSNLNKRQLGLSDAMPTGWACLAFDLTKRIPDMLDLYKYPSGIASNVLVDVTTQTNAFVVAYIESLRLIPPQAVR